MNSDVDYCGILNLLHQLVAVGVCTKREAKRISNRIAREIGASMYFDV